MKTAITLLLLTVNAILLGFWKPRGLSDGVTKGVLLFAMMFTLIRYVLLTIFADKDDFKK